MNWKWTVVPLVCLILATGINAQQRASIDEQVKALGFRYNAIEEQLPRSVRYARTEQVEGATVVTRAWFNGVGDPLKVTIERSGPAGRELTEYITDGSEVSWDGLFVVHRKELPQPDGSTRVEEARRYYGSSPGVSSADQEFGNGLLLRELTKSARFAAGEPLEMSTVRNVAVDFPKTKQFRDTPEERTAKSKLFDTFEESATALQAGQPEVDPFAGVTGDRERFRLIHATASPDGRYALAIGFDQAPDWTHYRDEDLKEEEVYTVEYGEEEPQLKNYVVELATMKILGETGGEYKGTRRRYNHRECTVTWSPDSAVFVALDSDKWNYVSCFAGRIVAGPRLSGVADVGAAATKEAERLLKTRRRKLGDYTALSVTEVKNDGTIGFDLVDQERSGERKGEINSRVLGTLKLREAPKGAAPSVIKSRIGPNE